MGNPGKNNIFVGSRSGEAAEAPRTKQASIKHENPEFFKRQSDRKNSDMSNENVGRGVGKVGKDSIPARKDVPIQNNQNHHQKNVGSDPGRGPGQVGRDSSKKDQAPFQMKQMSRGTVY